MLTQEELIILRSIVVLETGKWRDSMFLDRFKYLVIKCSEEGGVISYTDASGAFRQIGKSTLIKAVASKIDNSVIIVGTETDKKLIMHSTNINEKRIIIIRNSLSEQAIINLARGISKGLIIFDDSVCEDVVKILKKQYPKSFFFGFAYKNPFEIICS